MKTNYLDKNFEIENLLHHVYDVRELLLHEYHADGFKRYDVVVVLLAIENILKKNDYGLKLLCKMHNVLCMETNEKIIEHLKSFVFSWQRYGYENIAEIILTPDLHLCKGSDIIALALFSHQYNIKCFVSTDYSTSFYGIDSFFNNGFSMQEINMIQNRFEILLESIKVPFVCLIWDTAEHLYDDITNFLNQTTKVIDYEDYAYSKYQYSQMIRQVYTVDDVEKWKVEEKIKSICYLEKTNYKVRKVLVEIEYPNYRRKHSNGNLLSIKGEEIKKIIRDTYKTRIERYIYDNIIHMGDNYFQNMYVAELFKK